MSTEPSGRDFLVWSARGGHGSTTIAGALAQIWGTPLQGDIGDVHRWAFGPRKKNPGGEDILVTDSGPLPTSLGSSGTNIVELGIQRRMRYERDVLFGIEFHVGVIGPKDRETVHNQLLDNLVLHIVKPPSVLFDRLIDVHVLGQRRFKRISDGDPTIQRAAGKLRTWSNACRTASLRRNYVWLEPFKGTVHSHRYPRIACVICPRRPESVAATKYREWGCSSFNLPLRRSAATSAVRNA